MYFDERGAQDGGVWDKRVCVGSPESLDLKKVSKWKIPPGKGSKKRAIQEGTDELWTDVEKCSWIGILGTTDFSGK